MKNNMIFLPSISIGIPTYECGESLVYTLASIYRQSAFSFVKEVILAVDGKEEIPQAILSRIQHKKLRIVFSNEREGQSSRINTICSLVKGELLVLTNDDVIIEKNAIEELGKTYIHSHAHLIAAHVKPLPAKKFIERVLSMSYEIHRSIGHSWSGGNNYLMCNGRLIALNKVLYTTLRLPKNLHNSDSYIYLYNRIHNKTFALSEKAYCFYRNPATIMEYVNQSTKFQFAKVENEHYFKTDLTSYFAITLNTKITHLLHMITKHPLLASMYTFFALYTRGQAYGIIPTIGYWKTDSSTKKLYTV